MDYWPIIIAGLTLILVIVSLIWGTGLWMGREKILAKIEVRYTVRKDKNSLNLIFIHNIMRSGRHRKRYANAVLLKPEKEIYNKLCRYFKLPEDGVIRGGLGQWMESDEEAGASNSSRGYEARTGLSDDEWKEAEQLALNLGTSRHEVGVQWGDSDKVKWKTISGEDMGKWV